MDGHNKEKQFFDSFKKSIDLQHTTSYITFDGIMALEATFQQEVIYIPSALWAVLSDSLGPVWGPAGPPELEDPDWS